jgi:uncharacterized protein (TIGR01777 family)
MDRVVITGGTGYIGRLLASELLANGYEVVALSRNPDSVNGLAAQVRVEQWDAATGNGWSHLADGALAIVNLAGENLAGDGFLPSRWTDERKARIRDSRLRAGQAVVQAVEAATVKPKVVIQSSGIGHYGPRDDKVLTEDDPPGTDFLARLTVDWENSTAAVIQRGIRHVSIRSAVVLSPHDGALKRLILPFKLFAGGPMGSGKQGFPWIHPADEVAAIRFLIETQAAHGPFNLVAPEALSFGEFGVKLARVMGRPYWLPVPAFALRGALGEVASTVLEGQKAAPKKLLDLGFQFKYPTAEAALRELIGR